MRAFGDQTSGAGWPISLNSVMVAPSICRCGCRSWAPADLDQACRSTPPAHHTMAALRITSKASLSPPRDHSFNSNSEI